MKQSGKGWEQILKHLSEQRPLTTFEASKICGVVHTTVSNWIDEGKLTAYKTPGGHRRIQKEDLLTFLKMYEIPVPKELLTGSTSGPIAIEPKPTDEHHPKKTILIVEDEPAIAEIMADALSQNFPSFEVSIASDGFEAGKKIVTAQPVLLILDLILPGMDGFKVLSNIRQDKKFSKIKIIAVSGYDTSENKERLYQAGGVEAFLTKPIDLHKLRVQAEKLLAEALNAGE